MPWRRRRIAESPRLFDPGAYLGPWRVADTWPSWEEPGANTGWAGREGREERQRASAPPRVFR